MTWVAALALAITMIALMPVLFMALAVERKSVRETDLIERLVFAAGFHSLESSHVHVAAEATPEVRNSPVEERDRTGSVQYRFVAAERQLPAGSEYTIRKNDLNTRRPARNGGGISDIALVLYDRKGNGFMVHRRLCLN